MNFQATDIMSLWEHVKAPRPRFIAPGQGVKRRAGWDVTSRAMPAESSDNVLEMPGLEVAI